MDRVQSVTDDISRKSYPFIFFLRVNLTRFVTESLIRLNFPILDELAQLVVTLYKVPRVTVRFFRLQDYEKFLTQFYADVAVVNARLISRDWPIFLRVYERKCIKKWIPLSFYPSCAAIESREIGTRHAIIRRVEIFGAVSSKDSIVVV